MGERTPVAVVLLALVILAGVAVPGLTPPAAAKSFRIAAVQVEAALAPDGSMAVVEHITYDFDGDFSTGTRPIPRGEYEIVDMRVSENGEALPFDGAPYDLAWHFRARDERRTFDIAYTVARAARVGPDVGELYWKFVGDQHPGVGRVRVALEVPGDGLDIRAWAHGPLSGGLEIRGTLVLMSVDGLPAGRFVEGRVAVPAGNFTVAPTGGARLPAILAEEQRLADEANAERRRQAADECRRQRVADALEAGWWLAPLAGAAVFLVLFRRYGREHEPAVDAGEYLREPPDDPPAYVQALFAWRTVKPEALSATLVDLAQRGYLTITEVRQDRLLLGDKVDWRLTRTGTGDPAALLPFEERVLSRLFANSGETTQDEFRRWCEKHRTSADRWWTGVKDRIRAGVDQRRWFEGGKGWAFTGNVAAGLVVLGVGLLALSFGQLTGVICLVAGVVQLALTPTLRRRTPAGVQRLAEWKAFERFLRDFSSLEEAPVGHLILWERYLVYAVALGVAAPVARALAARIAEVSAVQGQPTFAPWFSGPHGTGALGSVGSFSGFAAGFGPTIVAAARPPSSSSSGSGGGGGFSGGGGGGGGGGGIGAR
ncbi:MAG TPA: DUF2207 domain-containing protein [Acidimicrobiales bacterium]|nr:DUF2207 domain-containing protein [Acidimicrobiales bacterium]